MRDWEKFTAIGAVGPDLFYFSQDYNNAVLGPLTDELMLALATYYFFDFAKENDYEPLLIILDQVNSTMAGLLRFLIKLQKIWQAFVDGWNQTIGPIVADITNLADDLTGGLLSEFGVVLDELKTALKTLAEEELLTYKDIFTQFRHLRAEGFRRKALPVERYEPLSPAIGPMPGFCQTSGRSRRSRNARRGRSVSRLHPGLHYPSGHRYCGAFFVNEQCGGPFRNHPQRHHLDRKSY